MFKAVVVHGLYCCFPRGAPASSDRVAVFLHGFGGSHQHWFPLLEHLNNRYVPVLFDFKGHGKSNGFVSDNISGFVEDISTVLSLCNIKKPVFLIGHSLGGLVGQAFYINHSEKVARLVLISTAANVMIHPNLLNQINRSQFDHAFILECVSRDTDEKKKNMIICDFERTRFDKTRTFDQSKIADVDFTDKLGDFLCDTMIIYGDKDKVVSPRRTKILAKKIPGSTIQMLTNIGHYPHLESPKDIASHLNCFLE